MRAIYASGVAMAILVGCGPPPQLRQMHAAYNGRQWAAVTERFADMGRPTTLDGISYARVALAAERVHIESKSPAYRELAVDSYNLAAEKDRSLADEHYFELGLLLERTGDRTGAVRAYRDALAMNPQHVPAACRAADLLEREDKPADVILAAQGLMKVRAPVDRALLDGLLSLSRAYAATGNRDASLKVLQHVAAIGPPNWEPDVLFGLARHYEADKENGRARLTMRKAISMLADDDSRRSAFQRYLQRLEASAQAMAGGDPDTPPAPGPSDPPPSDPGSSTGKSTNPDTPADPGSSTANEEDPTARAARLAAQASLLADENKVDEAIELLKQAVALAPKVPAHAAQLAILHVKAGDMAAAVAVLKKGIENNPDSQVLKTMLGRIQQAGSSASQPGS